MLGEVNGKFDGGVLIILFIAGYVRLGTFL